MVLHLNMENLYEVVPTLVQLGILRVNIQKENSYIDDEMNL